MSKYAFHGRLDGMICDDCPEPLSNVQVRAYRLRNDPDIAALAAAPIKESLRILDDDEVQAKAPLLLVEATTDADGNFILDLDRASNYGGEAFEIDVYCGNVPRQKPPRVPPGVPPRPRQFHLATINPAEPQAIRTAMQRLDYVIPYRWWCPFRALFGAWTICGTVRICDEKSPVAGVKVAAFDADWWQPDALGDAITDAAGRFRIDYTVDDFRKTPFSPLINIEWAGGPDIYFRIEGSGGTVLLDEPSSRARQPDRENVGPCFCVSLCVDVTQQPPFDTPWFTHVGDFHIYGDVVAATGLTNSAVLGHGGPGYGFFGATKLIGFCPKQIGGQPARYRFRYEDLAAPGTLEPITGALVHPVNVGSRLILWDIFGTGPVYTFQTIRLQGAGATVDPTPPPALPPGTPWGAPPAHVIVPDTDGWIAVDPNGLDGGFYGPLVRFDTTQVQAAAQAPGDGAGNAVSSPRHGIDLRIVFEAAPATGPAAFSNSLDRMHVNNWLDVMQLDLLEFSGGGTPCSKITNAITLLYTVDHELTAAWSIGISTAATPAPAFPVLPSGTAPRGAFGSQAINVSTWPSCAYVVSLGVRRRLTDGENDDSGHSTQKVFCK
ncbi:hypothetical protein [Montanilutibacter psychrotolerans]|uniref:Carboxypeptidase regulatory-like domain-containing protein n=1 Tax=Montanilutibacter psychrotolerans TaxID=1327343 RepID=A0A3M8SSD3_9GAMM|nr:hypothetical protein [Lysobacter psychrotolerans]RNF84238.1 hypothetical protein EER27_07555 [Lysobacter psychrotolerans]